LFLVSMIESWISVPSTKNENYVFNLFFKIVVLNPIWVMVVSLPLSTIDFNPLEIIESWNR
jgi:hypothetical protein